MAIAASTKPPYRRLASARRAAPRGEPRLPVSRRLALYRQRLSVFTHGGTRPSSPTSAALPWLSWASTRLHRRLAGQRGDHGTARNIVRRDTGEGYREMLEHRLARESGIAPTAEDLARLDASARARSSRTSAATPRPRSPRSPGLQARAGGSGHRRGGGGGLHPADEGDLQDPGGGRGKPRGAPTAEDPAEW